MYRKFLAAMLAATLGIANGHAATLRQAVVQALDTNPVVAKAKQNRNAVDHELEVSRGAYLPQVDVVAGYGIEFTNDFRTRQNPSGEETADLPRREASLRMTQRVFDGFETDSRVARGKAGVREAGKRVVESAESIAFEAVSSYLEVVRQREILVLADQLVAVHVRTRDSLRRRRRAGVGTAADTFQTEVRLERARALRLRTMNNLRDAEAFYQRVVGAPPDKLSRPKSSAGVLPVGLGAALQQIEGHNPRVAVRKAEVAKFAAGVDVATAAFYPRVNIEADGEFLNDADGIEEIDKSARVMLRLRWNLYRGGADISRRREALARLSEAKSERRVEQIRAEQDMREAWNAHEAAVERSKRLTRAVEFSARTRDSYRQQFRVARRSLLDVLDAEQELFTSRILLIRAEINRILKSHEILALSGQLLKTLEISLGAAAMSGPSSFFGPIPK